MSAEIPDGAVLVARGVLNSSLWTMRAHDRIVAMTCICLANWKPARWWDGKQELQIQRGQFARSWEQLSRACNLPIKVVRTSVQHLEKVGFLARASAGRYSLFTLPKYDFYQDFSKYSDSAGKTSGSERAGNGQRTGNKQERREERKKERSEKTEETTHAVPKELSGLSLYAEDQKLCERWHILFPEWKLAFPAVDVLAQIRKAHAWEITNPQKQKKDRPRFLNGWLGREQDAVASRRLNNHGGNGAGSRNPGKYALAPGALDAGAAGEQPGHREDS